jgi:hypothetical protein
VDTEDTGCIPTRLNPDALAGHPHRVAALVAADLCPVCGHGYHGDEQCPDFVLPDGMPDAVPAGMSVVFTEPARVCPCRSSVVQGA